jgi:hypothetical protein
MNTFSLKDTLLGKYNVYPMIVNLRKGPLPLKNGKQNCVGGGGDFKLSAAEMFSLDPNPTRTKNAWSSSTCLLYGMR